MRRVAAAGILLCLCCGPAGADAPLTKAPDGKPIVGAIKRHLGTKHPLSEEARFTTAFTDLNGDGKLEAVVYLVDSGVCGSGGCMTYVLSQTQPDVWKIIGRITISRPPIYKLPPGKDGWAELGVTVSGGGLRRMVMAVPHERRGYVQNPTVPPSHAIDPGEAEVLLSSEAVFPRRRG
jgi:hypothetical protein